MNNDQPEPKPKTCPAKTRKGIQCKNRVTPGKEFCWRHQISRVDSPDWKTNTWVQFKISGVLAILAVIIGVVGFVGTVYYGKTGATKEGQDALKSDLASIKKRMGILDEGNGLIWSNKYPYGYTLLTLTTNKQVIPFKDSLGDVRVRWDTCTFEITNDMIFVHMPHMRFPNGSRFWGNTMGVYRRIGATEFFGLHPDRLAIEMAASEQYGDVVVLGLQPDPLGPHPSPPPQFPNEK